MEQSLFSRDRRARRRIKKENTEGSQSSRVEYGCGVRLHSSGIGDKAIDLCVLWNLREQGPV